MSVSWTDFLLTLSAALAIAVAVMAAATLTTRLLASRWRQAAALAHTARRPFRVLTATLAVDVALRTRPDAAAAWWPLVEHTGRIVTILATAWMVTVALLFLEDLGLARNRVDVPDNRAARRLRTQVLIVRRLTVTIVVVVALGAVLLTFRAVEAVGASVLASAGLLSVVAGLAAQSTLGNVFAGLQLAFSDAVRIDDAVIVEGEWGWVEEITLTYVVVRVWDDRRLILPSKYFASTPFQNWTRRTSELLGSVELDVDWAVDTEAMREELDRIVERADLWDGRVKVLQVTDAVGGWVRVRVLVTAKDAPTLWDLRCHVREQLVTWVRRHNHEGLPRRRVEVADIGPPTSARPAAGGPGLFTGDPAAEERAARAGGG